MTIGQDKINKSDNTVTKRKELAGFAYALAWCEIGPIFGMRATVRCSTMWETIRGPTCT